MFAQVAFDISPSSTLLACMSWFNMLFVGYCDIIDMLFAVYCDIIDMLFVGYCDVTVTESCDQQSQSVLTEMRDLTCRQQKQSM